MREKMLSVVVPVYNEAKNIPPFLLRVEKIMNDNQWSYEIIFCMDPCKDSTYSVIKENMKRNRNIKLIQLSRRFGQYPAVLAGLFNCEGEACVIMDVDLQDPPELIQQFVEKWR